MDVEFVAWDMQVRGCEDLELLAELQSLARGDRRSEVRVLVCLAEVDERKLFLGQGYSCLFRYATGVLRMSEQQAYLRIQVARLARRFPVVLEMLAEGEVNLSTLKMIGPHLTAENHAMLLERARNKTKAEVEVLVAEIAPMPDVCDPAPRGARQVSLGLAQADMSALFASASVAPLQAGGAAASADVEDAAAVQSVAVAAASVAAPATPDLRASRILALKDRRGSSRALGRGRYHWQMTAGQSLQDKLKQLQHLLRHRVPSGEMAVITELAFDLLIEKTLKQRFAQVSKPRSSAGSTSSVVARVPTAVTHAEAKAVTANTAKKAPGAEAEVSRRSEAGRRVRSRSVPNAVLREVYFRDGGRCTFESSTGHRCDERGMLEVHHVHAYALGGKSTIENLKLVCRAHNQFFAEQDFGAQFMRKRRAFSKSCSDQGGLFGR